VTARLGDTEWERHQIRVANAADIPSILAVEDSGGREGFVRRAVMESRTLVSQIDEDIVGFCVGASFFGFDFLELLFVAASHRRQGIGSALVEAWEERAQSAKLFTSTNSSNVAMQRMCERMGYMRSGVIENLDEGDPELVFFKPGRRPE
jgi:GNAT superfamily N-acetyltransferase